MRKPDVTSSNVKASMKKTAMNKMRKGLWSPEEDEKLMRYMLSNEQGCWSDIARNSGLQRCGKSCRLRWINYLRPDLKRGAFSPEEEHLIVHFHSIIGNKWSQIAARLPGRTDNEIKNFWNSALKKRLKHNNLSTSTSSQENESDHSSEQPNVNFGGSSSSSSIIRPSIPAMHNEHDMFMMSMMYMDSSTSSSSPSMHALTNNYNFDPAGFSMLDNSSSLLPQGQFGDYGNYLEPNHHDRKNGITQGGYLNLNLNHNHNHNNNRNHNHNNNGQVAVDNNIINNHFHYSNNDNCFVNTASKTMSFTVDDHVDGDVMVGQGEEGSLRVGEEWDFEGFMQDISSCFV